MLTGAMMIDPVSDDFRGNYYIPEKQRFPGQSGSLTLTGQYLCSLAVLNKHILFLNKSANCDYWGNTY